MKILKNTREFIPLLLLILALGASSLLPTDAQALLSGNSVRIQQEGGGGGSAGGTYTNTGVVIPEMTPSTGSELVTDVAPTDPSGLSTYRYNVQVNKTLWRSYNRHVSGCPSAGCVPQSDTSIQGWIAGLSNPNVTVGYDIGVYNASSNVPYGQNANVPVGTQIKLVFGPYISNNIYWYGTGYSADSPYGEWTANATPAARSASRVTCVSQDYVLKYNVTGYGNYDVYIPLVVNPPARSVSVIPPNLSCGSLVNNGDGSSYMLCDVTGTGPIVPRFHFDATYGKFYYRYYDYSTNSCWGNNIPMSDAYGNATGPSYNTSTAISAPYQLSVPDVDIDYTLNGVASGNPPASPTLSCPSSGTTGSPLSFTVSATDPQGDTVRYGLDWTNAGTVNEWSPATGYVPSGTAQTISHTWSAPGTYTVRALAEDASGNQSAWASCPVTISAAPATVSCVASPDPANVNQSVSFTPTVSGGSGNYSYSWSENGTVFSTLANPTKAFSSIGLKTITVTVTDNGPAPTATLTPPTATIVNGNSTTLTWSSTDSTSCTSLDFTTGGATSGSATVAPSSTKTYTLSCTGSGGTVSKSATVTVTAAPAPTASLSASPTSVGSGGASTLTWSSANATTCTGTNFSTGNAVSGSVTVNPLSSTTYTLDCTGPSGSVSKTATVTIVPAPTVSISASPTSITLGAGSTITWSSTNATSCTSAQIVTSNATSGSVIDTPSSTTTYTMTCTGPAGSASNSVTVTVSGGGGGGGGGTCFAGNMPVTMVDGSTKPISEIVVGDVVLGQAEDGTRRGNVVTHIFVHDGSYDVLKINGSLVVTPNHPMRVLRNGSALWLPAGQMRIGDEMVGLTGVVSVTSIESAGALPEVNNLEVMPDHTYFAGGFLVHNKLNQTNFN